MSYITVREGMCEGMRTGRGNQRGMAIGRGMGWRRGFRRWGPIQQRYARREWSPVNSWWPQFYKPCKEGCTLTGNGGYGCPYPGNGYNQCQFAQDCSGCQSWW